MAVLVACRRDGCGGVRQSPPSPKTSRNRNDRMLGWRDGCEIPVMRSGSGRWRKSPGCVQASGRSRERPLASVEGSGPVRAWRVPAPPAPDSGRYAGIARAAGLRDRRSGKSGHRATETPLRGSPAANAMTGARDMAEPALDDRRSAPRAAPRPPESAGSGPPSGSRRHVATHSPEAGAGTAARVRFVTAASLFDGHDASINIMRRILQSAGAEVVHPARYLAHRGARDRSVAAQDRRGAARRPHPHERDRPSQRLHALPRHPDVGPRDPRRLRGRPRRVPPATRRRHGFFGHCIGGVSWERGRPRAKRPARRRGPEVRRRRPATWQNGWGKAGGTPALPGTRRSQVHNGRLAPATPN